MDLRTGADIQLYFKVKNLKYNDFTEAYKRLPRPDFKPYLHKQFKF